MTVPTPPATPEGTGQLGPGTLQIGETGSEFEADCLVNSISVEWTSDTTDSTKKLCGNERAGVTTFSATLSGNLDVDAGNESGLFSTSWAQKGDQLPFRYVPNSELGTEVSGELVITPLNLGASAVGDDLTSDFAWEIIGDPVLTFAPVVP